jgi:hypothetical protein
MLRFHAKSITELVDPATFAGKRAVQEIAGVKLQPRLGRQYLEHPSRGRFRDPSQEGEISDLLIENPVMVVTIAKPELFVVVMDTGANCRRSSEIERRAFD